MYHADRYPRFKGDTSDSVPRQDLGNTTNFLVLAQTGGVMRELCPTRSISIDLGQGLASNNVAQDYKEQHEGYMAGFAHACAALCPQVECLEGVWHELRVASNFFIISEHVGLYLTMQHGIQEKSAV